MVGMNPARDLSPRLVSLMLGWGFDVFTLFGYWSLVTIVSCHLGGVAGVLIYKGVITSVMEDRADHASSTNKTAHRQENVFKEVNLNMDLKSMI